MQPGYSEPTYSPAKARVQSGWLVILASAILPFLLLAGYNYASIHDDYGNSNRIMRLGRQEFIHKLYATWTGRYTELVLKAYFDPLSYQQTRWLAHIQPVVVICLLAGAAYLFFRMLLRGVPASVVVACSLLLTVLYLNGFDMVGASLYWFGGYTSITAGVIASLLAFAAMLGLHRYQGQSKTQLVCLVAATCFSVLAIGAYDVSLMAICWVLGSAMALAWLLKHPARWWFTFLFFFALLGAYVAMTAPGNQVRAMSNGRNIGAILKSPQVVVILIKSFYFALTQSLAWANSLILLLGSALLTSLLARNLAALQLSLERVHPTLLALWLLAGLASMVFPSVLVYRTIWPHSWECVYLYFLLGWVGLLTAVFIRYRPHSALLQALGGAATWRLACLAFCGLCFFSSTSNTHQAYLDLLTYAPEFYSRVLQRQQAAQVAAARHAHTIELQPLYSYDELWKKPKVLYTYDFNADDAVEYAHYYGVDSVRINQGPYHP